jgi:hypothetical protein
MQVTGKRDPTSIVQRATSSRLVLPRQSPVSRRRSQAQAQAQVQALDTRRGKSRSNKSAGATTRPVGPLSHPAEQHPAREQVPGLA